MIVLNIGMFIVTLVLCFAAGWIVGKRRKKSNDEK